ncbi:MAG: TIGR01244 family phosphatase, partial [Gluconacetobacter diazotrophicus]|nr:TIGR01244 family phosphatase [Gluconacetobacter diazotrophicus]
MVKRQDLDRDLTVSGQLAVEDLHRLAQDGVRTIINNRPDGEEPGQLPAGEAARITEGLGLAYVHVPVTSANMGIDDAEAFAAAVTGSDGPVHAHCRSGARSTNLWMLGRLTHGSVTADEARCWAAERRVDLGPALAA